MISDQPQASNQSLEPTAGRHDALIRVFDAAGNVIETQKHEGEYKQSKE
jgi:hypothetical protein